VGMVLRHLVVDIVLWQVVLGDSVGHLVVGVVQHARKLGDMVV
jgi:hypothetical protein